MIWHFFISAKVLILLFILSGCAINHDYSPDPNRYSIGFDKVPELQTNGTISIVNVQYDETSHLLAEQYPHKYNGNYRQITDAAVTICTNALNDRGVTASMDAQKSLKLSVVSIEEIPATWVYRLVLDLEVEDGNGMKKLFKGDNTTGGSLYRGLDGAIHRAVVEMLNDKSIQAYLNE